MKKYLIMMAGLPGTGKTTLAKKLYNNLENYEVVSQNEVRRRHGIRKMPKTQDKILREIDRTVANFLNGEKGVIVDSVNRYSFRRHQIYGIASCCGKEIITLEIICSETEAKRRIKKRSKGDGLISDPTDPFVYDKLAKSWEDISIDFKYPGEDHVSHVVFDTEKEEFKKKIVRKEAKYFVNELKKILLKKD